MAIIAGGRVVVVCASIVVCSRATQRLSISEVGIQTMRCGQARTQDFCLGLGGGGGLKYSYFSNTQ